MRFYRDPAARRAWLEHDHRFASYVVQSVAPGDRSTWASSVVAASLPLLTLDDPLRPLLEPVAARLGSPEGPSPRDLFDEIRLFSLQHHIDGVRAGIARLAELACKVMHNATGGTPPFDDDSGARLVEATAALARLVPDLEPALWSTICSRRRQMSE